MITPQIGVHHSTVAPHILVMDESREVLSLLHQILAEEGFSLTLSSQLLDLEQIRVCSPALILMERRFDGLLAPSWDVVRRTRQDRDLAHVPIVLSTTHRSSRMSSCLEQELRGRGVHVLLKPYDINDLLGTIQACLSGGAEREVEESWRQPGKLNQPITSSGSRPGRSDCQLRALLFSDGRVVVYDDPLRQLAKWHILGRIRQDGELLSFLRIDAASNSWTALVPSMSLEQETLPLCIPLFRQADSHREPLTGWPLFS
jgi:CheY-like chemotaxis protein